MSNTDMMRKEIRKTHITVKTIDRENERLREKILGNTLTETEFKIFNNE